MDLETALADCPLVAILRGIRPDECQAVGTALVEEGYRIIEVPLNSPEPMLSITRLNGLLGTKALIGAGTVMDPSDVDRVMKAGGRLIVMPHSDSAVIAAAKKAALWCVPGVATPTEAFAALGAGADALKLFPAEGMPPSVVKAWRAVVSPTVPLLPVGGIDAHNIRAYLFAGAAGFGIGSAIYKPGKPVELIRADARTLIESYIAAKEAYLASQRPVGV